MNKDSVMQTTLCIFLKDNEIMLALKKRGFGEGKYNGVGGKLEKGETLEHGMIRECVEEIGATPTEFEKVGYIEFDEYYKGERTKLAFHLFFITKWDGDLIETDEMAPHWFSKDKIPYDSMFADDQYWLPLVLEGKKVKAFFNFDKDFNIISKEINVVEEL